jgi:predicted nucleotidyltransferase
MVTLNLELMQRARATTQALRREGVVRATYLFGSHVEGRADQWSDIDIAAFMDGAESWDIWRRAQIAARVQKEVGYDIEPHFFSTAALTAPEAGSFAEYVVQHGIPIDPDEPRPMV